MKKVKTFFDEVRNSLLPHHTFYQRILRRRLKDAFLYFVTFIIVLNGIFFISVLKSASPTKVHETINTIRDSLILYPRDLVITIEKGNLVSNSQMPYLLWTHSGGNPSLLAVVDETGSAKSIFEYHSIVLLTKKNIVIWPTHKTKDIYILPFTAPWSYQIDNMAIQQFISKLVSIDRLLTIFYLIGLILLFIMLLTGSLIVNTIYIVGASFLALLFFRFIYKKNTVRPLPALKIALHAISLPLIVDYGLTMAEIRPPFMHILFFILFTIFVIGGIYESYWAKGKD